MAAVGFTAAMAASVAMGAGFGDNNVISTNVAVPAYVLAAAVGGTTTSNLSTVIPVKLHDEVGVSVRFRLFAADDQNPTQTFRFGNSVDGTNVDNNTATMHTLVLTANGTNWVQGSTNFYVGSFPFFGGGTVTSASTNAAGTNYTITFEVKSKRNGL